ncbi:MAG: acyl carrier protein [Rhodoplanes sp.]
MDRVMQQKSLVAKILAVLKDIAPDADVDRLDPRHSFRDQFDLDSVDYLNFVMALEVAFAIRIPDADYPRLSTLAGCVAYLERAVAEGAPVTAAALSS